MVKLDDGNAAELWRVGRRCLIARWDDPFVQSALLHRMAGDAARHASDPWTARFANALRGSGDPAAARPPW
jgi:hypothetical protein